MSFEVIVHGARDLERAFTETVIEVDPTLSKAIRALADPVRQEAASAASAWQGGARTAAGFRVRRRGLNVRVEQGLSKTTGAHPNWGGLQMRHFLIPALDKHEHEIEAGVDAVIGGLIGRNL